MKLRESDPHGEDLIYNEPLLEEEESKEEDDTDPCDADVKDKDEIRLQRDTFGQNPEVSTSSKSS